MVLQVYTGVHLSTSSPCKHINQGNTAHASECHKTKPQGRKGSFKLVNETRRLRRGSKMSSSALHQEPPSCPCSAVTNSLAVTTITLFNSPCLKFSFSTDSSPWNTTRALRKTPNLLKPIFPSSCSQGC